MAKRYSTSLTDAQWQVLEKKLPEQIIRRKRKWPLRLIFDGVLYLLKNGVIWRDLPSDFPPHDTLYYYFKTWRDDGLLDLLNLELSGDYRERAGRARAPSVGIIDSQSVKTISISSAGSGYDAGKNVKGRKRHIIVDILGLLLTVVVHPADLQDRDGAKIVFERLFAERWDFPMLRVFFADSGYAGQLLDWFKVRFRKIQWQMQIVKRTELHAFKVLPKRWVVERTFAWLGWNRRLSKDYERLSHSSEAFVKLAMIRILLIRLAKN